MQMDTPSRNQRSSIEEPRIGWLFDDSLENADLEEDLSDGTDHVIANCIEDCEPPAPLTSSASPRLKQQLNRKMSPRSKRRNF